VPGLYQEILLEEGCMRLTNAGMHPKHCGREQPIEATYVDASLIEQEK